MLRWMPAAKWTGRGGQRAETPFYQAPDWLIFVEGVNCAQELGVARRPLEFKVKNRLVYSVRLSMVQGRSPEEMRAKWERNWAFFSGIGVRLPRYGSANSAWRTCFEDKRVNQVWFETFTPSSRTTTWTGAGGCFMKATRHTDGRL